MTANLPPEPRVLIRCNECYKEDRELGIWTSALTAEDVEPEDLYPGHDHDKDDLWCAKTEHLIYDYECSAEEAQAQAELLDELEPELHEAMRAWTRTGMLIEEPDGLPDVQLFKVSYLGEFHDFKEFAEDYANNTGFLDGIPDEIAKYFDWERYAQDLKYGFVTEDTDNGESIHVFVND